MKAEDRLFLVCAAFILLMVSCLSLSSCANAGDTPASTGPKTVGIWINGTPYQVEQGTSFSNRDAHGRFTPLQQTNPTDSP